LLAFSRKQILLPRIINLNDTIKEMEKILRRLIGENVRLRQDLDPKLANLKIDPGQIQQVIMNLSINARDAMPSGGEICIETRNISVDNSGVHTLLEIDPGDYVMLVFSDTGIGMDTSTLEQIVETFITTKGPGQGTGLGLSTVHGIGKQSGGSIRVYSEPGKGTTFKIYFPQATEATETDQPEEKKAEAYTGNESILVVEDDNMVRKLAVETLTTYGYQVTEAPEAEKALDVIEKRNGEIDLILTDIVIPGDLSGTELAQEILRSYPQLKVLFMSGYTEDTIVRHRLVEERINYLQKPFSPHHLLKKIRAILDEEGNKPELKA
jgi:CheY-like chemotaxis protein